MQFMEAVRKIALGHTRAVPGSPHRVLDSEAEATEAFADWNGGAQAGAISSLPYQNVARWMKTNHQGSIMQTDDAGDIWLNNDRIERNPMAALEATSDEVRTVWAAYFYVMGIIAAMEPTIRNSSSPDALDYAIGQLEVANAIVPRADQVSDALAFLRRRKQVAREHSEQEKARAALSNSAEAADALFKRVAFLAVALVVLYFLFR